MYGIKTFVGELRRVETEVNAWCDQSDDQWREKFSIVTVNTVVAGADVMVVVTYNIDQEKIRDFNDDLEYVFYDETTRSARDIRELIQWQ
jgi:hypothetical protein